MLRATQSSLQTFRPLARLPGLQCRHSGFRYTLANRSAETDPDQPGRKHPTLRQLITYLDIQKSGVQPPVKATKKRRRPERTLGKGFYVDTTKFVGFSQMKEQFLKEHQHVQDRLLTDAEIAEAVEAFKPKPKKGKKEEDNQVVPS